MELTNEEIQRYSRHLLLSEIGQAGQVKLKKSRVLIVGAGGLGSPAVIYLAAAGVGTLGIIDADKVDLSNLHRQVIHFTKDTGIPKVISARQKIAQLNPNVNVITYETRFNAQNALEILKNFDLIVDGTDNFPSRYLINDACIISEKTFVFGGIFQFEGQVSVFGFKDGPCYRCFFQEPPAPGTVPSCAEAGVVGTLPGIIGSLQASEAIKLIVGIGEPLKGRLLLFDGLATRFREIHIKKNPACPMCGPKRTIHELKEYTPVCADLQIPEITAQDLKKNIAQTKNNFLIIDVREAAEWQTGHIEKAILKPLSSLETNFQDIPKDKPVYVYCKLGGRGRRAIEFLKSKGYENLINLKGGFDSWVVKSDTDPLKK